METTNPEKSGMSAARLKRIDSAMQRYVDEGKVPAIQTAIFRRGRLVQQGCYGHMDAHAGAPLRSDALYRIYSMTKAVTCAAILTLVEEGRIRLSDPVAAYIPSFRGLKVFAVPQENGPDSEPLARPILLQDLLTHTAGLAYGLDTSTPVDIQYQQARMLRPDELLADKIERLARLPLLAQPGTRWIYSMSIDVIGRLVEILSGKSLDAYFKERIFDPLGMTDTFFNVPPSELPRLPAIYLADPSGRLHDVINPESSESRAEIAKLDPAGITQSAYTDKSQPFQFLSGGGGLTSSLADYASFVRMLAGGGRLNGERILSRKTVEHMVRDQMPPGVPFGPGLGMGFGVVVVLNPAHAMAITSPGAFTGGGAASTEFWVDPSEQLAGIIMTQVFNYAQVPFLADFRTLAYQAVDD